MRGKHFLIPVDAEINNAASVRDESVDMDQVLDQLSPAHISMVILDACRNNPFKIRFRRVGGGLAKIDAPTVSLLAYATAPGSVGTNMAARLRATDIPGLNLLRGDSHRCGNS